MMQEEIGDTDDAGEDAGIADMAAALAAEGGDDAGDGGNLDVGITIWFVTGFAQHGRRQIFDDGIVRNGDLRVTGCQRFQHRMGRAERSHFEPLLPQRAGQRRGDEREIRALPRPGPADDGDPVTGPEPALAQGVDAAGDALSKKGQEICPYQ